MRPPIRRIRLARNAIFTAEAQPNVLEFQPEACQDLFCARGANTDASRTKFYRLLAKALRCGVACSMSFGSKTAFQKVTF
jgi:hypothetical protein